MSEFVPINFIKVSETRQRKKFTDENIQSLADSIASVGLIQPIVIDREGNLIAGERRLRAHKKLGLDTIRVVYQDTLDPDVKYAMELEENVKRQDLEWKEECEAYLRYHEFRQIKNPGQTIQATADELSISNVALSKKISVAIELRAGNKLVVDAPMYSTAVGIVVRQESRKNAAAEAELSHILKVVHNAPDNSTSTSTSIAAKNLDGTSDENVATMGDISDLRQTPFILNADFLEWASSYEGPKFNFIHCDFPYGINADKFKQGASAAYGGYADTPDLYWALVDGFLRHLDNFCEESAHLIFWFSMDYYSETLARLRTKFNVQSRPLIWHKDDGAGIIPDPKRTPRRTWECAFFASRGDRFIVKSVADSVAAGITRGAHMSEKPQEVLRHFFRLVVDEHSTVLDPTCGSGSAIRAAAAMGAGRYLGLEINPEFAKLADERLYDQLNGEPDLI